MATALACGVSLLLTSAVAAPAALAEDAGASAAPEPREAGLFGETDPTYDGVWRQSVALLAQTAAGYVPAGEAVDWLLAQQCDDGSFQSYRPDPAQPCGDVTAADSNATALAVQALAAVGGHGDAVTSALDWLTGVQNADGGWGYKPGDATDGNSTGVVVGAYVAAGEDPAGVVREGHSPYDALIGLQLGCDAPEEERGAFAWQPDAESGDLAASDLATVDAVLGLYGSGLLVDPELPVTPVEPLECGDAAGGQDGAGESESPAGGDDAPADDPAATAGAAGAARLAAAATDGGGAVLSTPPGGEAQPDHSLTTRAVLALAAGGHEEEATTSLDWLRENHGGWVDLTANPTALGMLVLAAHALGASPQDFGGTDLVAALNALGPAPNESAQAAPDVADDGGDDGPGAVLWVVVLGLVAGIGIGVVFSLRRGRARKAD